MKRAAVMARWLFIALGLLAAPAANAALVATQLDWDVQVWDPAGSNGPMVYPIGSGNVTLAWTGTTGSFVQNRPQVGQAETGGLNPVENSLSARVNYAGSPDSVVLWIDFSHPGGVRNVSFTIFDVDASTSSFSRSVDQIQVTGTGAGAAPITPSNVAVANPAYVAFDGVSTVTGLANVPSPNSSNGNVTFTFNQAGITQLRLVHRSPPNGPANPGNQFFSIHDIDFTYDEPVPDLAAVKTVATLQDSVNAMSNPKAIPGSTIGYTIEVTNSGTGAVDQDSVVVIDRIPVNTALVVLDYDAMNPGPVAFDDQVPSSGLGYSFLALDSVLDDIAFSNDGGVTFDYEPSDSGNGTDPNVTHIRVNPKGTFAAAGGGNPAFRLLFKVRVQ